MRRSPRLTENCYRRFLVHVKRDLVKSTGISAWDLEFQSICPHSINLCAELYLHLNIRERARSGLGDIEDDIKLALKHQGKDFTGHCTRCQTDYSVRVIPFGIRVQAWYDLGSYKDSGRRVMGYTSLRRS